jgi:hypothetical protein
MEPATIQATAVSPGGGAGATAFAEVTL